MKLKTSPGVWRKAAPVLVALCTMSSLMLTQTGVASAAATTGGVTVGANISTGSGGGNPTIECSWIVGDHNTNGGSGTEQYNYPTNSDLNPTGANKTESTQTPTYSVPGPNAPLFSLNANTGTDFVYASDGTTNTTAPCDIAALATQPTMAAGGNPFATPAGTPTPTGVSFTPNAFDSSTGSWVSDPGPAPKRVEIWSAVDYATNVIFDVFYPNGTEDTELGGIQIGGTQACSNYNTAGSLLDSMFGAAGPGADNEVSANAWENGSSTGIIDHCNKDQKSLWYQAFTISKDDPSGTYVVEVRAQSTTGSSTSWFSFGVNTLIALAVNFTSVSFANDNGNYEISGSTNYVQSPNTVACDAGAVGETACVGPTVINGGNQGMEVGIAYQPLVDTPAGGGSSYLLDGPNFDVNLAYNGSDGLGSDLIVNAGTVAGTYGSTTWITNNTGAVPGGAANAATGPQLVCPNDDPELDLSLSPSGAVAGTYTGSMELLGEADPVTGATHGGCLTDNGAPYVIAGAYKSVSDKDVPTLTRS
ncbi:MAG: hypothetical protein ABSE77_11550 [Acidimicrobiales bacterium]